jgi:hypothetical protein
MQKMHRPTLTDLTRITPRSSRSHTLPRLGALLVIALAIGCGGAAGDSFTGPETMKIKATSATTFSGQMGDLVTVAVDVDQLNDLQVPVGTKVTFTASDGGFPTSTSIALPPDGTYQATWRLGPAVKVQTLTATVDGARPLVFKATVTGNPWAVTTTGSMSYVSRLADEGSISPGGSDPWSATMFGSAPRLIISCQAGTVGIALTHPKMQANGNSAAYSFNGAETYTQETWNQVANLSDSLFHPGPTSAAGTLAKQIAASSSFRLVYLQYFPTQNFTVDVTPSFGTAGLSLVMPQLMANCPAGR